MRAAVYGDGLFVAVGDSGDVNISGDHGQTWSHDAPTAMAGTSWQSICFGNGRFVAVGNSGTDRVAYYEDGTWVRVTPPADNQWMGVCFGDGLFVAVAADGTATQRVMTSSDGETWTLRTTPSIGAGQWFDVTWGDGLFVAIAAVGGDQNVMTSPDGINWTIETGAQGSMSWRSITHANSLFVAISDNSPGGEPQVMVRVGGTIEIVCPTVEDVQESICLRSGLEASQVDVTGLSAITRTVC